jgi:DNA repair photolyase
VERIVELASEAGAVHIGGNTLLLRGSVREIFFAWLREHRPDLIPRYERLYARGAYVPTDERRTIEREAGAPWARKTYPERFRHRTAGEQRRVDAVHRAGGGGRRAPVPRAEEPPPPRAQQSLF